MVHLSLLPLLPQFLHCLRSSASSPWMARQILLTDTELAQVPIWVKPWNAVSTAFGELPSVSLLLVAIHSANGMCDRSWRGTRMDGGRVNSGGA